MKKKSKWTAIGMNNSMQFIELEADTIEELEKELKEMLNNKEISMFGKIKKTSWPKHFELISSESELDNLKILLLTDKYKIMKELIVKRQVIEDKINALKDIVE